jgi:hypothetical protein
MSYYRYADGNVFIFYSEAGQIGDFETVTVDDFDTEDGLFDAVSKDGFRQYISLNCYEPGDWTHYVMSIGTGARI